MIRLDFETRSRADLKKVGAWNYSKHPSTEVLCCAFLIENVKGADKIIQWKAGQDWPSGLLDVRIGKLELTEAHNAFFEFCIWQNIMVPRHGWPKLPVKVWRCSAAQAAAFGLPRSLEGASNAAGLSVTKDMDGRRIMLKMSRPRKPTKNDSSEWNENPADFRTLYAYNRTDVETETELSRSIPPLTEDELRYWKLDQRINRRGVYCDRELVLAALTMIDRLERKADTELADLTGGAIESIGQRDKIIEFCADRLVFLPNLTASTVKETLADPDLDSEVEAILSLRQSMAKTSTTKFRAMLDRSDPADGRIRETIRYYGAERTGRWAGMGIQPQNFAQGKFKKQKDVEAIIELVRDGDLDMLELAYGSPMTALSSILRACLCAAPGKTLIAADYKSIEARVLAWVSNTVWAVTMFRRGEDPYKDLAATIYDVDPKEVTREQRDVGKRGVLGLGYQMGAKKFGETCKQYGNPITKELANQTVEAYRSKYWAVTEFWKNAETLAKHAVRNKTEIDMGSQIPITWEYSKRRKVLYCILPSGRRLVYHDPKIGESDRFAGREQLSYAGINSVSKKWERLHTYGGKLTENIVQAIARDLLAAAMLELERSGFQVVLTVHDEIVAETTPAKADLDRFIEIMCNAPQWADGLPVKADGWIGRRFRK